MLAEKVFLSLKQVNAFSKIHRTLVYKKQVQLLQLLHYEEQLTSVTLPLPPSAFPTLLSIFPALPASFTQTPTPHCPVCRQGRSIQLASKAQLVEGPQS